MTAQNHQNGPGLRFDFAAFCREIRNVTTVSSAFLERESSERVLPEWRQCLENIKTRASGRTERWEIPEGSPIQTIPNDGSHEVFHEESTRRGHPLQGKMTCVWEIEVVRNGHQKRLRQFRLSGKASTDLRIIDLKEEREVVRWHFDIGGGTDRDPGCQVHAQIASEDSMPIPRMPSLVITPMDALDFLLGEVFQLQWERRVTEHPEASHWGAQQRERIERFLEWQRDQVSKRTSSLAWMPLKWNKLEPDLFVKGPA